MSWRHEVRTVALAARFCRAVWDLRGEPEAVVMIGMGVGTEAAVFAGCFPRASLLACEPDQRFPQPPVKRLVVDRRAVGARPKRFYSDGPMRSGVHGRGDRMRVEWTTLDGLLADHGLLGARTLLWLDAEGSEASILLSGQEARRTVDWVHVEVQGRVANRWDPAFRVRRKLLAYGLRRVYRVRKNEAWARA